MKVTLAAVLLLLAGCSAATPDEAPPRPSASIETPAADDAPTAKGPAIRVPYLVGSALRDIRRALAHDGIRIAVRHRARCVPGVVLAQDPPAGGEMHSGDTIEVVVATYPPAATCVLPTGRPAVRDLHRWAAGEAGPPRFADRVRVLVGNVPTRTLTGTEAADPRRWVLDVPYAEVDKVRILATLIAAPMRGTRVPPFSCMNRAPSLPPDLVDQLPRSWTLTTRKTSRTFACMQLAAVQVWAGSDGRITDVNVLMGSP
jgi:hypothetical protein